MQEVEAICKRVMVIREGRMLVSEPVAAATGRDSQKYRLQIAATVEEVETQINHVAAIQQGTIEAVTAQITRVEVELLDAFTVDDLFDWVVWLLAGYISLHR